MFRQEKNTPIFINKNILCKMIQQLNLRLAKHPKNTSFFATAFITL